MHRGPSLAFDGARREYSLETSLVAAKTQSAFRLHSQMAQVPRHTRMTAQKMAARPPKG